LRLGAARASRGHDTHQQHAMAPRLMGQTIERAEDPPSMTAAANHTNPSSRPVDILAQLAVAGERTVTEVHARLANPSLRNRLIAYSLHGRLPAV
jgi:hypothetical protein